MLVFILLNSPVLQGKFTITNRTSYIEYGRVNEVGTHSHICSILYVLYDGKCHAQILQLCAVIPM